ncbi:hypothetical protein D3C80_1582060 [compost metagenome]
MLCPTVAKALRTGFHRADAKRIMGVRLKRIAIDMGLIKLHARQLRQMPELGAIFLKRKLFWHTLQFPGSCYVLGLALSDLARRTDNNVSALDLSF